MLSVSNERILSGGLKQKGSTFSPKTRGRKLLAFRAYLFPYGHMTVPSDGYPHVGSVTPLPL